MGRPKIFLDSDVLISSLLSKKGASFYIMENKDIKKMISGVIKAEIEEVSKRLNLSLTEPNIFKNLEVIILEINKARLIDEYVQYVVDEEDSHVVYGAKRTDAKFLLTHNTKHYNIEKIKRDLGILVMKPGIFLQYLRSS